VNYPQPIKQTQLQ